MVTSKAPSSRQQLATRAAPDSTLHGAPSTSISNMASQSGIFRLASYVLTALMVVLSISSHADGTMPFSIMADTVLPAASSSLKWASTAARASGSGCIFNLALVMIPSVPSEPTINAVRSYPDADFMTLPPVQMIAPSGITTSRSST